MKIYLTFIDSKTYANFYGAGAVYLGGILGKTLQGPSDLVGEAGY